MIPVLALDVSIRSTGYATIIDRDSIAEQVHGLILPEARHHGRTVKLAGRARMRTIAAKIAHLVKRHDIRLIAIEDYAYNAHSRSVTVLAELRGHITFALSAAGIRDTHIIEPSSSAIKAYATGNGRADKDEMVAAAREHLGYRGTLKHPRDPERFWSPDVADSMWLHALVADAIGQKYAPDLPHAEAREKRKQARDSVVPLLPKAGVM